MSFFSRLLISFPLEEMTQKRCTCIREVRFIANLIEFAKSSLLIDALSKSNICAKTEGQNFHYK